MDTLTNSLDPDEMPHNAAFHQGLHCFLRENRSSEKEIQYYFEIITCDTSIYAMDHPDFIVCGFMENSFGLKRVKWLPRGNCHMGHGNRFVQGHEHPSINGAHDLVGFLVAICPMLLSALIFYQFTLEFLCISVSIN